MGQLRLGNSKYKERTKNCFKSVSLKVLLQLLSKTLCEYKILFEREITKAIYSSSMKIPYYNCWTLSCFKYYAHVKLKGLLSVPQLTRPKNKLGINCNKLDQRIKWLLKSFVFDFFCFLST